MDRPTEQQQEKNEPDNADILELLTKKLSEVQQSFEEKLQATLSEVDRKNSNFAGYLKKEFVNSAPKENPQPEPVEEKPQEPRLNLAALKQELENLRLELKKRDEQIYRETVNQKVQKVFNSHKLLQPDTAAKLFLINNPSIELIDGEPYVVHNNTPYPLDSKVQEFLKSEGSVFIEKPAPAPLNTQETGKIHASPKTNSLNSRIFGDE